MPIAPLSSSAGQATRRAGGGVDAWTRGRVAAWTRGRVDAWMRVNETEGGLRPLWLSLTLTLWLTLPLCLAHLPIAAA